MFKFVTRLFRKQPAEFEQYHLPSDDPGLNPIVVEETEDIPMEEVVTLNSRLLAPVNPLDPANMSARSRAVVEIKTGLNDLGDHIRMLGQRLHAQSMGQSKLIEALSILPATLKEVLPNVEEQNRALGALKLALDEQAGANRTFVEALKPLPEFVQTMANLPEAAKQQMVAITDLTKQLEAGNVKATEQSEQVKVMVETFSAGQGAQTTVLQGAVEELTKFQKAQLKQQALAVKSNELARRSQLRHQTEISRTQQSRLTAIQRDQSRHFNHLQEHFRKSSRVQMALTGVAIVLAVAALTFAALIAGGVFKFGGTAQPTAEAPRVVDSDAVVSR